MVIPVYTRNSPCIRHLPFVIVVYPCVYRELFLNAIGYRSQDGLSLCIQGTHYELRPPQYYLRFIPVYTGNSGVMPSILLRRAVYPCVYRELNSLVLI